MKVVIDGVEYQPRPEIKNAQGYVKPIWRLMAEARKHTGMTLAEVAERSGLCVTAVHRAEAGTVVSAKTLFLLAEVYGLPLDLVSASVLRRG